MEKTLAKYKFLLKNHCNLKIAKILSKLLRKSRPKNKKLKKFLKKKWYKKKM